MQSSHGFSCLYEVHGAFPRTLEWAPPLLICGFTQPDQRRFLDIEEGTLRVLELNGRTPLSGEQGVLELNGRTPLSGE